LSLDALLHNCIETIKKAVSKQKQKEQQIKRYNDNHGSTGDISESIDKDDGTANSGLMKNSISINHNENDGTEVIDDDDNDDDNEYGNVDDYMQSHTFTASIVGHCIPLHQLNTSLLSSAIRSNDYRCFQNYLF